MKNPSLSSVKMHHVSEHIILYERGVITMHSILNSQFAKGDKVKIDTDQEKAQQLQINHGGWQDRMKAVSQRLSY